MRSVTPFVASLAVIVLAALSQADAATVYQDSFTRGGNIAGSAPDVVNVPSQNWLLASNTATGNGTQGVLTGSIWLPFTPVQGFTYTLEADVSYTGSGEWYTILFAQNPTNWVPGGFSGDLSEPGLIRGGESGHLLITLDTTSLSWTNTDNLGFVGVITDVPGTGSAVVDNFKLSAVAAVPAPAALPGGLALLTIAGLTGRRRKA